MVRKKKSIRYLLSILVLILSLLIGYGEVASAAVFQTAQTTRQDIRAKSKKKKTQTQTQTQKEADESELTVEEDKEYTSKEEVALYLHTYGHLPDNYITKKEAKKLGWVSQEGNLWKVAPGKSIGGDYFGNYEGILPEVKGRTYYECDIDTDGHYRGAKRIIFSDDGWIYYTEDHYETFEELYTGEDQS